MNKETFIKELKKNGYKTKIVSGESPKLFNCENVYKHFRRFCVKISLLVY